ncbi:flagellar biosynthesis protein FlhA [Sulfitobacter mediterraneus]|jgi:flagellar biosynthesis protein FlhA|uniref:Flagellar biosynthesis protein FlhA n=1 Tax=Sulfitobacter mediterraneus TaxID=83219 RepID=A0A2T6C9X5_9RHOB|nr:flagellar biosynthesis protein FlhA [Sulfitobacter mediterraneus]KIN77144.1 Flagellar biosynthesis protein [Sulfitobacter mediterraneus KCTC 32188]PTX65124.1 flagellar biosynthesis protein FlhA [Sulfitobacter mediterraneus]
MATPDTNVTTGRPIISFARLGHSNRDIGFAIGVVLILAMLFVPLPPVLLDVGLAVSLSLAVLILMVSLWIGAPLEFNSFPTLLLVVTMLRLALNVSSTRLILSEGHNGPGAAGNVIEGFANFIVGGDFVIGIIVFAILVIINFIVITKGSTRIAEVAARFSLDAMPGKQMAIDADLAAGVISDEEAKVRRKTVEEESSFFGAMDGASKFVRGDAVAGLIITLINVFGGILIGMMTHDLSIGQAMSNYTVLTIGDGLVTQIPALIVSLAAGLLVTKGGTHGAANEAVLGQLSNFPKALYMAAGLTFCIGWLPGFPLAVFVPLAAGMAGFGYIMQQQAKEHAAREALVEEDSKAPSETAEDPLADMLRVDDVRLDLGTALVPMITTVNAALPGKVKSLRSLFIKDFGFVLPPVRIKDDADLPAGTYSISLQGVEAARGEVDPMMMMVINPSGGDIDLPGKRTREPTFGLEAIWVDEARASEAELMGMTVVDPESVITTHLTEVIKEHMPEILTYAAVQDLIEGQDKDYQKLLSDSSNNSPAVMLQHVLQALLAERVSIRNLPKIIEAVAEASANTKNIRTVIEHARGKLSKQICQSLVDAQGYVPVINLGGEWERELVNSISTTNGEDTFLMSPSRVQEFVLAMRKEIQKFSSADEWPAILVTPQARPYVRSILERVSPMTQVISHNEVHRKASLRTVGTVGQ